MTRELNETRARRETRVCRAIYNEPPVLPPAAPANLTSRILPYLSASGEPRLNGAALVRLARVKGRLVSFTHSSHPLGLSFTPPTLVNRLWAVNSTTYSHSRFLFCVSSATTTAYAQRVTSSVMTE